MTIDPITRLEGHGKITIFLNDSGNVENAYLQVPELRGFERFCIGRLAEEMPRITPRICGVCPSAHHMASAKTVDMIFNADPPEVAKKLREIYYAAHMAHSHIAHFYALGGPDFIVGPDAPPAKRNILGVAEKVGLDITKDVIKNRARAQNIQKIIGGRATHSITSIPGGLSKPITEQERDEIKKMGEELVKFGEFTLKVFDDIVLANSDYVEMITGDQYTLETYYLGLVDKNNQLNFYEGDIRVVDPEGNEFAKFPTVDYAKHIVEHTEPWSYLKFPYLKEVGWKGLVSGKDSGLYRVAPLARLNVSEGMPTPLAQKGYDKMYKTLGGKPVHHTLAFHWARVIEIQYAAERIVELIKDPIITNEEVRTLPVNEPSHGIGVVEAPRGTLFHEYSTDNKGIITDVNLIVATGNNYGPMCIGIKDAAKHYIKNGNVTQGLLNRVEMVFRAYDPCLGCATHSLPGETPLEVKIKNSDGKVIETLRQFC
ncbi:MAG: Ni/Fe hydrogenase subunit alpha [Candidatus Ranarchaeia archaeon]